MADVPVTALTDVETLEVSLVKRGANNKRIAIAKSEDSMSKKIEEVIKEAMALPLENEAAIDESLAKAGLSADAASAVKAAVQALSAFKDEMPDLAKVISMLGEMLGADKPEAPADASKPAEAELQKKLDALWKSNAEAVELLKKAELRAVEAETAKNTAEEVLKKERAEAEFKELVTVCERDYPFVAGSAEQKAKTIVALQASAPDQVTAIRESWKLANEQLAQSPVFKSAGSDAPVSAPATAKGKFDAKIDSLRTANPSLSYEQAFTHVFKNEPALRVEMLAETQKES